MTKQLTPQRWAYKLTHILDHLYGDGAERFPIDVASLAKEYSKQCYPDDPITDVIGDSLPGLEGMLCRAPAGKKGWGIIYNNAIRSSGRINFTLAHELGHYLIHRKDYPNGFECNEKDMFSWDSEYQQLEHQANLFASTLLMPLNDFRKRITPAETPRLEKIGKCAERYNVSLTAAILRWLEYTSRRSVLVVSRDGFILWARSSESAFKSGMFFKTRDRDPIPIPGASLPNKTINLANGENSIYHDSDVWLSEPCEELSIFSNHHDFTISLLHFDDATPRWESDSEDEEDTYDRMMRRTPGQSWLI